VPKSELLAAGVLTRPAVVIAVAGAKLPPIIDDELAAVGGDDDSGCSFIETRSHSVVNLSSSMQC
jgi:hypothetical protein